MDLCWARGWSVWKFCEASKGLVFRDNSTVKLVERFLPFLVQFISIKWQNLKHHKHSSLPLESQTSVGEVWAKSPPDVLIHRRTHTLCMDSHFRRLKEGIVEFPATKSRFFAENERTKRLFSLCFNEIPKGLSFYLGYLTQSLCKCFSVWFRVDSSDCEVEVGWTMTGYSASRCISINFWFFEVQNRSDGCDGVEVLWDASDGTKVKEKWKFRVGDKKNCFTPSIRHNRSHKTC